MHISHEQSRSARGESLKPGASTAEIWNRTGTQGGREILRSIAANVRRLRVRWRLTQAHLAERAELELRQLQRIERAEINFGVLTLVALAEALDVKVSILLRTAQLPPPRRGRPPAQRGTAGMGRSGSTSR